jgi:membrane protein YdbS with pleckstrin-like domain
MSTPAPQRPRRDVVSLVLGLLMVVVAGAALWLAFVGPLDWALLSTAAPLVLVAVGALGLVLTRR